MNTITRKHVLSTVFLLLIALPAMAQQEIGTNVYHIRSYRKNQDTVYYTRQTKRVTVKRGSTITETIGNITVQRQLIKDSIILVNEEVVVRIPGNRWKAGEVKHTNDAPDKLYLDPWTFSDCDNTALNATCYIKIQPNSYVRLWRTYWKWSAITIPFAIRKSLNDTIDSKVTTDLKAGVSFSYNFNWETFRNRRIEAKKNVKGLSFGIGAGFSKVTLNETSTSLSEEPIKNEEDGLAFFIAPGITTNIRGIQAGVFYGIDFGLTDNVKQWNYNKKAYWGIALGIGLDIFGKI
ncbi:hypothetical protein [Ohtaekwangia koreensis]|uniref:Outer membrane protein beta-barrel domain-containing protein n=1 Tax=Ohtaekwangia koreensis TaxID=688867 RepID=A0A1T5J9F4_9BACT|nr:hypothetical protein [Ohtaekwangia koreensis]SKC47892.1 hypothetical protein SAMN05660236_0880 [Ohtaekwangia koreensis]